MKTITTPQEFALANGWDATCIEATARLGVSPEARHGVCNGAGMIEITDCLGRTRTPDTIYEDGSWNCPFCMAAVQAGSTEHAARACPNPACFARLGGYPVERAREALATEAARVREREQRTEVAAWHQRYDAERAAERARAVDAIRTEASARGACVSCAIESTRYGQPAKFTRHRKGCPRAPR